MSNKNGMNWIRQDKRLAIYLRDGLACVYCGESMEEGASLTLDHVCPRERGGSNREDNLVTACHRCNSARQNRPFTAFVRAVAGYLDGGITAREIRKRVRNCLKRKLPMEEARELVSRRGSAAQAVERMRTRREGKK